MLKMHRYNEAFTFSGVIKSLSSFLISTSFLQNIAVLNLVEDLNYSWRILSFSIHFNYSAKLSSKHVKKHVPILLHTVHGIIAFPTWEGSPLGRYGIHTRSIHMESDVMA